jgi:hypothetical protein
LVSQVTQAAYNAFGDGLTIALDLAGAMLVATGLVCGIIYIWRKRYFDDNPVAV